MSIFSLQLVIQWTLIFGVKRQLDALREGFNSVLPLSNLTSFTYSEVRSFVVVFVTFGNLRTLVTPRLSVELDSDFSY